MGLIIEHEGSHKHTLFGEPRRQGASVYKGAGESGIPRQVVRPWKGVG